MNLELNHVFSLTCGQKTKRNWTSTINYLGRLDLTPESGPQSSSRNLRISESGELWSVGALGAGQPDQLLRGSTRLSCQQKTPRTLRLPDQVGAEVSASIINTQARGVMSNGPQNQTNY